MNTYSAWNMVLDTRGQNLDSERVWPQNALVTVDRNTATLTATPAYYVFRHISAFVKPRAHRIDVAGSGDALAFENSDGSIVTVVQFDVPAHGWATVNGVSQL